MGPRAVAGGFFPLIHGGQGLTPELGIGGRFVPVDVGYRVIFLALRKGLVRPCARASQTSAVPESRDGLFPGERAPVVHERVLPEFAPQITPSPDKLAEFGVRYLKTVDPVIIQESARARRTPPTDQRVFAARNENHSCRRFSLGNQLDREPDCRRNQKRALCPVQLTRNRPLKSR